jgi:hypothetical protein
MSCASRQIDVSLFLHVVGFYPQQNSNMTGIIPHDDQRYQRQRMLIAQYGRQWRGQRALTPEEWKYSGLNCRCGRVFWSWSLINTMILVCPLIKCHAWCHWHMGTPHIIDINAWHCIKRQTKTWHFIISSYNVSFVANRQILNATVIVLSRSGYRLTNFKSNSLFSAAR